MSETVELKPAARIRGKCVLPGDKSLSHRALILASLSDGNCRIENLAIGEDVNATIRVLGQIGVRIKIAPDRKSAIVGGVGGKFTKPSGPLDCGNSGTTMRLISGVLAAQPFTVTITGDASLRNRPVAQLAEVLNLMGAKVQISPEGTPPFTIQGGNLTGIVHTPKVASAQVKSAMLLAGLFANGTTVVYETLITRDHTERLLSKLGPPGFIEIDRINRTVSMDEGGLPLKHFDIVIPGDASSAAYPLALAIILPESALTATYVGLNPGRTAFYRHLQLMGAQVVMEPDSRGFASTAGEPVGDIVARSSKLRNIPLDPERIPAMIDELPLLSVISCFADGPWEIRDAERLRVKETDRIRTTAAVIRGMGGEVEEHPDGLSGPGGQVFWGGEVSSEGDHRILMIAAVAAWCSRGPSTIHGAECVSISFPTFFDRMNELVEYD
jgi:3-phosphoshikimate 1-carboxyvinyltransferase